uniref:Uncharacterized protein n=1 Tax=Latimeria chalumnae TaxID=7897 RepID=H3BC04_LATCH
RRHNPVDSICRKIRTIQRRSQGTNPTSHIPKFQSRNFDSPQINFKKNLETILKNRTIKNRESDPASFLSMGNESMFRQSTPTASPSLQVTLSFQSAAGNKVYSRVGTTEEEAAMPQLLFHGVQNCSTPVVKEGKNTVCLCTASNADYKSSLNENVRCSAAVPVGSVNQNSCTPLQRSKYPTLQFPVVKKLSLTDATGTPFNVVVKGKTTTDVSLICEEDLLATMFYACDSEHT